MQRDANLSKALFYNSVGHYNFISTCRQLSIKGAANQKNELASGIHSHSYSKVTLFFKTFEYNKYYNKINNHWL